MAAVFEATGFPGVPAPPYPRLTYDEAMLALRLRPARHAFRAGDPGSRRGRCGRRSSRCSRARCRAGGVVRGINAGRARAAALRPRPPHRAGDRVGGQGPGVGVRGGGRRLALADRQVPLRRRARGDQRSAWTRRRATCCSSSPTGRRWPPTCSGCCGSSWPSASTSPRATATTCSGWSTSRCSSRTPRPAPGTRSTIPFTAPEGDLDGDPGAAALARLRPRVRRAGARRRLDPHQPRRRAAQGARAAAASGPRRRRSGSGSCSTRSSTARRRTAGSRSGIDRIVALHRRARVDPRGHPVPQDGERHRPPDRRSGAGRPGAAARGRAAARPRRRRASNRTERLGPARRRARARPRA